LTIFIVNWELTRKAGRLGELVHVERLVRGLVGHRDADDVVRQAEHAAAFDDLVEGGDPRLEGLDGGAVLEPPLRALG
jgi:hypothetical protein